MTTEEPRHDSRENAAMEAEQLAKLQSDNIIQTGSVITKGRDTSIFCLSIIGQIEGHYVLPPNSKTTKYEHVIPMLVAIEENPKIDGLLLLLNTIGGDVEAGLAIAEVVAGMTKPTVSIVLGGGHSIGIPLAVAAKKSLITKSATMTLHPVRTNGLVINIPQSFMYFTKMQRRIIEFIVEHSHAEEKKLNKLINKTDQIVADAGTVIDCLQAVEIGLIDRVGNMSDALEEIKAQVRDGGR